MAKTYLLRIDDEETWRWFHSLCALRGTKLKDAIWRMIEDFVRIQPQKKDAKQNEKPSRD
jgi:hypothetical protein